MKGGSAYVSKYAKEAPCTVDYSLTDWPGSPSGLYSLKIRVLWSICTAHIVSEAGRRLG